MRGNLIPVFTGVVFLVIGVFCLFWPEKIQEYALKWSVQGLGKFNPFLSWMKTRSYILALRIIGIMAIAGFLLVIFALFKSQK